jgi:acetyl-CoA synthetase
LEWFKPPTKARKYTWNSSTRTIEHTWFEDGELNVTVNCLDRHLKTPVRTKPAIIWQGEPGRTSARSLTRSCTARSANSPMS